MAFEEFKPVTGRFTPSISIGRGGFGFSAGFTKKYKELFAKKEVWVKLFYDKDRRAVGFKFTDGSDAAAIRGKTIERGGVYLNTKSFFVTYDIKRAELETRYEPRVEETPEGALYVIELKRKSAG